MHTNVRRFIKTALISGVPFGGVMSAFFVWRHGYPNGLKVLKTGGGTECFVVSAHKDWARVISQATATTNKPPWHASIPGLG